MITCAVSKLFTDFLFVTFLLIANPWTTQTYVMVMATVVCIDCYVQLKSSVLGTSKSIFSSSYYNDLVPYLME